MNRFSNATAFVVLLMLIISLIVTTGIDARRDLDLDGVHLRTSIYDYRPFFLINRGSNMNESGFKPRGLSADILEFMAELHNLTWDLVPVDPAKWAKYGPEIALKNQLIDGEVDFVFFPFKQNLQNFNAIEITFTTSIDSYTLLQPWPHEISRLTAPVRPFSDLVWMLIAASSFAVAGVLGVITYLYGKWNYDVQTGRQQRNWTFRGHLYWWHEYVITILTTQGNQIAYKYRARTFVTAGLWLLSVVVVVNAYTGTLISYLTVPKLTPVIDTLEQLVTESNLKFSTEVNSDFSKQILAATSGVYKIIGDSLRKDPGLLVSDYYKPMELVTHDIAVFFCSKPHAFYMMASDYKTHKKCRMTVSSRNAPAFFSMNFGFGMAKNGRYNKYINRNTLIAWDYGFQYKFVSRYFPRAEQCELKDGNVVLDKGKSIAPLAFDDVAGIFSLLGIGLAISFLAFMAEFVIYGRSPRNVVLE